MENRRLSDWSRTPKRKQRQTTFITKVDMVLNSLEEATKHIPKLPEDIE